jgi:hypothetical protein
MLEYSKESGARKEETMASIAQMRLFKWDQIDAASDLQRLRLVLEAMPVEDSPMERRGVDANPRA